MLLAEVITKSRAKINTLNPKVKPKVIQWITNCYGKGVVVYLTYGTRSIAEQNKIYAQGRTAPGPIVTYAKGGESYHNFGLAWDFALLDPSGKLTYKTDVDFDKDKKKDWDEALAEARKLLIECGADFKKLKDLGHLQVTFGLTLAQLRAGKRP